MKKAYDITIGDKIWIYDRYHIIINIIDEEYRRVLFYNSGKLHRHVWPDSLVRTPISPYRTNQRPIDPRTLNSYFDFISWFRFLNSWICSCGNIIPKGMKCCGKYKSRKKNKIRENIR